MGVLSAGSLGFQNGLGLLGSLILRRQVAWQNHISTFTFNGALYSNKLGGRKKPLAPTTSMLWNLGIR